MLSSFLRSVAFAVLAIALGCLPTTRSLAEIQILHHFSGADGRNPASRLVAYQSDLIGVTRYFSAATIFRIGRDGSGIETLKSFTSGGDTSPVGVAVSGSQLFGMVERLAPPNLGSGVFRFSPLDETYDQIHSFEGSGPHFAGLLSASGSTLFGTITQGLSDPTSTLFKVNSDGSGYQSLHEFVLPSISQLSGPVVSGDYVFGATPFANPATSATLYRIRTDGSGFETLHTFNNVAGEGHFAGDFAVAGSTIYGAVSGGVQTQLGVVSGSVYKQAVNGSGFEVLRAFSGGAGAGSLVVNGTTLYGVAYPGAPFGGPPAIFEMNTDGTGYEVLHDFSLDPSNPGIVTLALLDGQLYGTTSHGGQNNMGTIFAVPMPEPSSILLAIFAIASVATVYRGRKRSLAT
jgi:uncharacterized repeat protein (TIGR03803 family)